MEKTDFEILLDRIETQYGKMKSHMEAARWFWKNGNTEAALERAMKLEELSEKYILNCRALPLYTDNPQAKLWFLRCLKSKSLNPMKLSKSIFRRAGNC